MPSYINTNVSSLNAQRQLNKSQMSQHTAMTRLSSGLRINSAKDDAAGLAIADRMSSQITGLNQASRNANDGISLAQTAEGALGEITSSLQRLRELAVQSANATNTTTDRAAIQEEVTQLTAEIQRVSTQTEFNGTKLLDGSFKAQSFQVGANAGQTISISLNSASAKTLGTGDASAVTARAANYVAANTSGSAVPAMAKGDVILNGVSIDASVGTADDRSFSLASSSAIAKAAAFNAVSSQTGVTATVNATTAEGVAMSGSSTSGSIYINGVQTSSISTTTDTAATRQSVITAINAISDRTGVKAVDSGTDAGGVKLVAADGRNISVGVSGALTSGSTGLNVSNTAVTSGNSGTDANYRVFFGTYTLSSTKEMKVEAGTGTIGNSGLQAGTFAAQTAYTSAAQLTSGAAITAGDFKINGVLVGDSLSSYDTASSTLKNQSAISKAAAINAISKQSGVTATVNETTANGTSMTAGAASGTVTINGFATSTFSTSATDNAASRRAVVQAINDISGKTGVKAIDTNDDTKGVKLVAADGRNIDLSFTGVSSGSTGLAASGTVTGSVTLSSAKTFTIDTGTTSGSTDVKDVLGLNVGTYGEGKSGQSLDSIDLSTAEGAAAALTAIDNAIKSINSSRGSLGAVQNRFTSTISSLQTSAENLSAARSRIQDADFASETATLSRAQVLQQAGTAMLSQANASTQNVLSLLR